MRHYRVTAELQDPITQRRARQSQVSDGLAGIRGTTLRGALAKAYLDVQGDADDRFQRLFTDEAAIRYGGLFPWQSPMPLTATSCKRFPGFLSDLKSGHGVVDQLWLRVAEQLYGGPLPMDVLSRWMYCQFQPENQSRCGAAMKPITGGWNGGSITDAKSTKGAPTTLNAHVGIDRHTGTAAKSIFYTLQAVQPTEHAWAGSVQASEQGWQAFRELLELIDYRVRIGHARTRGYGRIRLSVDDQSTEQSEPTPEEAKISWSQWNQALHDFLAELPVDFPAEESDDNLFFSITFPAGAILVDSLLRYTLDPGEMVAWLPKLRKPNQAAQWESISDAVSGERSDGLISSVTAVTKHELVRGWNAAHGLPKADEYSVAPGSVYVYRYRGESEQLWSQLERLTTQGVGLRTNEGFGQVQVSDVFHNQFSRPNGGI